MAATAGPSLNQPAPPQHRLHRLVHQELRQRPGGFIQRGHGGLQSALNRRHRRHFPSPARIPPSRAAASMSGAMIPFHFPARLREGLARGGQRFVRLQFGLDPAPRRQIVERMLDGFLDHLLHCGRRPRPRRISSPRFFPARCACPGPGRAGFRSRQFQTARPPAARRAERARTPA